MQNLRYLESGIREDLKHQKMVFLGGPRQVGKTFLSLQFLKNGNKQHPAYLNWDISSHRKGLKDFQLPEGQPLLVLDEIHKYPKWKSLIKGIYDRFGDEIQFIVTGSARLDVFQKGGDSLLGRYHYYRLHPLSLGEVDPTFSNREFERLLSFGGFPEPFFRNEKRYWRRWQMERQRRVIREDIRDLTTLRDISQLELLMDALPSRIGSPLSIQNLREDLEVSHDSVSRWIRAFERFYLCFRISPFGSSKVKAVKKEQKLYFWDWSGVSDAGARFENLVASQLLKKVHFNEDYEGIPSELRYLRDMQGREVDFVFMQNKKPLFAVECKLSDARVADSIRYFSQRVSIPIWYQVHSGNDHYETVLPNKTKVIVLPYWEFCKRIQAP